MKKLIILLGLLFLAFPVISLISSADSHDFNLNFLTPFINATDFGVVAEYDFFDSSLIETKKTEPILIPKSVYNDCRSSGKSKSACITELNSRFTSQTADLLYREFTDLEEALKTDFSNELTPSDISIDPKAVNSILEKLKHVPLNDSETIFTKQKGITNEKVAFALALIEFNNPQSIPWHVEPHEWNIVDGCKVDETDYSVKIKIVHGNGNSSDFCLYDSCEYVFGCAEQDIVDFGEL